MLFPDRKEEKSDQSSCKDRSIAYTYGFAGRKSEKGNRSWYDEPPSPHASHIAQPQGYWNDDDASDLLVEDWQHVLVETLAVNTSIVRIALAVEFRVADLALIVIDFHFVIFSEARG